MSSDLAVSIRGLSKSYTIRPGGERPTRLAEAITSRMRHPLRRGPFEEFVALRDVSFDLGRGGVFGVIGSNGAGKSTLLKILSRITTPTAGEARVYGRVGSLLEVGTGFHPELTGRENIYLNGAILGMRRAEVARRFDEIVEFAGVEHFIETPVKRYSSGMYVRLAFAVAAHLDTDILLIDEVLAVGDGAFQQKSLGKMGEAASSGKTVLVVSHNVAVMSKLAGSCVVLEQGAVAFHGETAAAIEHYMTRITGMTQAGTFANAERWHIRTARPVGRIVAGSLDSAVGIYEAGGAPQLRLTVERLTPDAHVCLRVTVQRVSGEAVGTAFSPPIQWPRSLGRSDYSVDLSGVSLSPGQYVFELDLRDVGSRIHSPPHDCVLRVLPFEIAPADMGDTVEQWPPTWGSVSWEPSTVTLQSDAEQEASDRR